MLSNIHSEILSLKMSRTVTSKVAFSLFSLIILCATCRAQSAVSIISGGPASVSLTSSTHFTPDSPSSSFDSLGTGSTTSASTTIFGLTEPTYAPTMTTCWIQPTGTISTQQPLDPSASIFPGGAECMEIIRASGEVIEVGLFTVAEDGSTHSIGVVVPASTSNSSSSSSSSSIGTGSIVGAVIGSVFGTLLIGATLLWIRKQRRSSKPVGTWLNRPAGWVRDEKQPTNVIEMTRRGEA